MPLVRTIHTFLHASLELDKGLVCIEVRPCADSLGIRGGRSKIKSDIKETATPIQSRVLRADAASSSIAAARPASRVCVRPSDSPIGKGGNDGQWRMTSTPIPSVWLLAFDAQMV